MGRVDDIRDIVGEQLVAWENADAPARHNLVLVEPSWDSFPRAGEVVEGKLRWNGMRYEYVHFRELALVSGYMARVNSDPKLWTDIDWSEPRLDRWRKTPFLVIEDFAASPISDEEAYGLDHFANFRHEQCLPTIITTRLHRDDIPRQLAQDLSGDSDMRAGRIDWRFFQDATVCTIQ